MDPITVPAVVRTRAGVEHVTLTLTAEGSWAVIEAVDVVAPTLAIDGDSLMRLAGAWATLTGQDIVGGTHG